MICRRKQAQVVVLYHFVQNVDVLRTYDVKDDDLVTLFISADGIVDRDLTRLLLLVAESHEKLVFDTFGGIT